MKKFLTGIILLFTAICLHAQDMRWTSKSKSANSLARLAVVQMVNAEMEMAYSNLQRAVESDPDFSMAHLLMTYVTTGEIQKKHSELARKTVANKSESEKLFISTLEEAKTEAEKRFIWSQLHQMHPNDPLLHFIYAFNLPSDEEKLAAFLEFEKKYPNRPEVYNQLGYLYMNHKKDNTLAKKYFEKYIELLPGSQNPYDSMGDYYLHSGDPNKAEEYFRKALQKYPYASGTLVKLNELNKKKTSEEKMVQAAKDLDMKFVQAFNEGNLQSFMESYWNSPEVVTYPPDIIEVKGWIPMKESFTGMFETMKGTKFELTESHNLAAGDYVIGWGKFAITFPGSPGTKMNGRYTDVKTFKEGKWVYIMDHGSFPMSMGNDPADVKKIQSLLQQEMQAGNAGDADAYMRILSPDVEIIPSGGSPVKGTATKKWMQDFFKENALDIAPYTNEELVIMGNLAYHRYDYSWKISPKKGGKSMKEKGTGMHLFKKNAYGEWQMIKDIWTPAN